jgi:peptidase E
MIETRNPFYLTVLLWIVTRAILQTCAFAPKVIRHYQDAHKQQTAYSICTIRTSSFALNHHPTTQRYDKRFLNYGILISSFTDGILGSPHPKDRDSKIFLKYSLLSLFAMDIRNKLEDEVEDSVKYSPCAGPNIDYLNSLETLDSILQSNSENYNDMKHMNKIHVLKEYLQSYLRENANDSPLINLKLLYIPTAMYALRSDSQNTPGKQRQRARADGKKRRDQLVSFLQSVLDEELNIGSKHTCISTVTLDLDDGSIKQLYHTSHKDASITFPSNGKDALTVWNPHIIYIEGGNTFWLWHCIDKGDWKQLIVDACCTEKDSSRRPSLYIGKSAGAIVAGKYVETACWKGWDDPSIVPGREEYNDWKNCIGLNMAGGASFFPHMNEEWTDLVEEKMSEMGLHRQKDLDHKHGLYALDDNSACCIEGSLKTVMLVE